MKKIIITFLTFLILENSFAQISTTKVAAEIPKQIAAYDSLTNFLGNDYKKYKGQMLYVIPKAEILREYGYEGFIIDTIGSYRSKVNQFKCCDGYNSKYDELEGKYFLVEEVYDAKKSLYGPNAYLKLRLKDTEEIVFFTYNIKYKYLFPFLVVGYYEKQKKIFVNNEVLVRDFPIIEGVDRKKQLDTETGIEVEIIKGKYLKCLDVTIDQKYFEPALLLKNEKGQKFLFALHNRYLNIQRILTKQEAEKFRIKFGEKNWQAILNEKVLVGFSEEMALVSWGEPDKINKASYGDQWVYEGRYLYFKNGILKSFN